MKVLVVEDTNTIRAVLRIYLMGFKLDFIEAKDGEEGLRKARETSPDLIISDVRMPVMDGFELCTAIRSDKQLSKTPIVLITMQKDEATRQRGREVGATAFLGKPVAVDELRELVGRLLHLTDLG